MKHYRLLSLMCIMLMTVNSWAKVATNDSSFNGYSYDNAANLWKAIDTDKAYTTTFYYAPNWAQIADPEWTQEGSKYTFQLPAETYEQWQAQAHLIPTGAMQLTSEKTYDFSCVISSNVDISKVTVKFNAKDNDNNALFAQTFSIKGGDTNVFYMTDMSGIDGDCKLVFDFGGNAAGCTVSVDQITLKDHAIDDGTVLPTKKETGYTYNYKTNLWKTIDDNKSYTTSFWYAPGWSQIADPEFSQEGSIYTFKLPSATTDTWQAQCFIIPTELKLASDTNYDFSCIINSTTDNPHVTVKLTDKTSDGNFLFSESVAVSAGKDYVLKLSDLKGIDADCKLVLDFGGNGANCTVTVREIVLKNHAVSDGSDFNGYNYDHEANLWKPINDAHDFTNRYYYAPGWNQLADPELTIDGSKYTYQFPTATSDQWQNQCFFTPTQLKLNSDTYYDFSCILNSSSDISHVTVKLTDKTSAGNYLFAETFAMEAGVEKVFYLSQLKGIDADCEFVFDFGGNGDNCTVTIDRITLKDHSINDGTVVPGQEDEVDKALTEAYEKYQTKCAEITEQINSKTFETDERDILYAYLNDNEGPSETYPNGTMAYILEQKSLTKEQILAEIEWLDALYKNMINNSLVEGTDVTYFLTNSDMSQSSFKGWELTIGAHGANYNANSGVGMEFWPCAEAWNDAFDVHQTVENMPNGLYEIGVYAYYRPGAIENYDTEAIIPCQLYMNDFYTTVKNITDDPLPEDQAQDGVNCRLTAADGVQTWSVDQLTPLGYLPNGEWSSSYAFSSGRYYQKVYGMVLDGKMTLGIRNTGTPWYDDGVAYWSKFKLIYMGKNIEALNSVIESYEQRANSLTEGSTLYYKGHDAEMAAAIQAGKAATDANEKYNCVISINDMFNTIDNSTSIYTDLQNQIEAYLSWAFDESSALSKEEKDAASEYYNQVWDKILASGYTDEEALAEIEAIKARMGGSGINGIRSDKSAVVVYNMNGQQVSHTTSNLKSGMYIIQTQGKTFKQIIR